MSLKNGCGNPECKCSSTVMEQMSFGKGRLSCNGFWEFPCWPCAAVWKNEHPQEHVWPESAERAQELTADEAFRQLFDREEEEMQWFERSR